MDEFSLSIHEECTTRDPILTVVWRDLVRFIHAGYYLFSALDGVSFFFFAPSGLLFL